MRALLLLIAIGVVGCTASAGDEPAPTAELSRRQKDSLIADMPLPGSGAVGRALNALEATERRAEAHDSIS